MKSVIFLFAIVALVTAMPATDDTIANTETPDSGDDSPNDNAFLNPNDHSSNNDAFNNNNNDHSGSSSNNNDHSSSSSSNNNDDDFSNGNNNDQRIRDNGFRINPNDRSRVDVERFGQPEARPEENIQRQPERPEEEAERPCTELDEKISALCGSNKSCEPCVSNLIRCPDFDRSTDECTKKIRCMEKLQKEDNEFFSFCTN